MSAWPDAYLGIGGAGLAIYLWLWSLVANAGDAAVPSLALSTDRQPARAGAGSRAGNGRRMAGIPASRRAGAVARARSDAAHLAGPGVCPVRRRNHHPAARHPPLPRHRIPARRTDAFDTWCSPRCRSSGDWSRSSAMVAGTRRGQRFVWFAGASLLGIVLAKMFLVDLSRTGTIARIVSFIGVGVLMLIIGRFSPVPPATPDGSGSPRRSGAQVGGMMQVTLASAGEYRRGISARWPARVPRRRQPRDEFAWAIPIEVPAGAPVVRLDVPRVVYRDCVSSGAARPASPERRRRSRAVRVAAARGGGTRHADDAAPAVVSAARRCGRVGSGAAAAHRRRQDLHRGRGRTAAVGPGAGIGLLREHGMASSARSMRSPSAGPMRRRISP